MKNMPVTWALMEVLKDVNKDRWFKNMTCILGAVYQSCRINSRFYFVIKVYQKQNNAYGVSVLSQMSSFMSA